MTSEDSAERRTSLREAAASLRLPLQNGEPLFEKDWQAQAFGLVVGLWQSGVYQWDDFKMRLIREIDHDDGAPVSRDYYVQFLDAFTHLALERELVTEAELHARMDEFVDCTRPDQCLGSPTAQGKGVRWLLESAAANPSNVGPRPVAGS